MPQEFHDPLQGIRQLRQTLAADKLSVGFFLGAGCPCAVSASNDDQGKPIPLIPDIRGLTVKVSNLLSASEETAGLLSRLVATLGKDGHISPTIETMLDRIRGLREVAGNDTVRGFSFAELDTLDRELCKSIKQTVSCDLPNGDTPYHALAQFIANHRSPISELFTTNYDLLIEQALEASRVPFFDGFVGSARPFFDQRSIEDDVIPARWSRLWKLHGSINWRFHSPSKAVIRSIEDGDGDELLIHPSHRKYDESRRMPYFVMIDRLRNFMRNSEKPVALVIMGYSFADEHLNAVIIEALNANTSAAVFALQFDVIGAYPKAKALALEIPNLSLLARDAAIIRRSELVWMAEAGIDSGEIKGAFELEEADDASEAPRSCKFLLGDFRKFGTFLNEFSAYGTFSSVGRTE